MTNNKSPGSSGFSAEFYKCFWKQLGDFVCRALNHAFISGNLSITQTQGIITCIPKGDKPKQYLKNWRPITLLNTIYKIGSGCIANRLKIHLDKLINNDQTGFIKGRFIGENIRLIYDIMQYTEENNIPGLLLLIDFEKAFDSLSWTFVNKTLSLFNFGKDIKRWFNILYKDGISAICQNGFLSNFFNIQRGCRQGDPLSCYVFVLCAEILSQKIRSNKNIKGIKMNQLEHKLSQFADDTTIILNGSASSLNETLNVLSTFTIISGLKVNFEKTKVVWIGKEKFSSNSIKTKWKLSWNQQGFDMLGIKFHVDLPKMIELNYRSKLLKAESILKMWKRRIITPIGRIVVIKTLVLSLFNHLFVSLPDPPKLYIKQIETLFFDFIWQGPSKIRKDVLIKDITEGGLNMIDLNAFITALKTTWIRRIIRTNGKWLDVVFKIVDINKLFNCGSHYPETIANSCTNSFWKDTLTAFVQLYKRIIPNHENILENPLFYNPKILIGKKSIFLKSWFYSGVQCIGDIFTEDGTLYDIKDFNNFYNLNANFVHFQGVCQAVVKYLKNTAYPFNETKTVNRPYIPSILSSLLKNEKGSQPMHNILKSNSCIPSCKPKWEHKFNVKIDNKVWNKIFSLIFNITKDTNLQWFQYRIIHRILGTNELLYKINYKDNPKCSFCNKNVESLEHLFWDCKIIFDMIHILFSNFKIKLTRLQFLLGMQNADQYTNLLLVIVKKYIYNCKMLGRKPSIEVAKRYIDYHFQLERNTK